jgi:carbamoyl-phosphate synthase large subunit
VTIVAADMDEMAPGQHLADYHYIAPSLKRPQHYLDFLAKTCRRHEVKAMFPCFSRELSLVSSSREMFRSLGVEMLVSPPQTIDLCNDKLRMAEVVERLGIPVPKTFTQPCQRDLPLFSKYTEGSSSIGAIRIDDAQTLEAAMSAERRRIYQEFVDGMEYTVDILCGRDSTCMVVGPRKRIQTKAGQTVKGVTVNSEVLDQYSRMICKAVGIVGACNIQFIERQGTFHFIELNPRYAAGGLMLTVHAGANIPFLALKMMLEMPICESELQHAPDVAMTRYWEEIILDGRTCAAVS